MVTVDIAVEALSKIIITCFLLVARDAIDIYFDLIGVIDIYCDLIVMSQLFFDQKDCGKQSQVM